LQATLDRRGMLRLGARLGAAFGALQLVGCGDTPTSPTTTTTTASTAAATTTTTPTSSATCSRIPEETEGPYPADGSNGPVQEADASGRVTFQSIYPGCYAGRWPHIHFEVYPNLSAATSVRNKTATSQIALPKAANDVVYATAGYGQSVRNAAQITLASDGIFRDGSALELATTSGDAISGLTATLTVAV
jgi:hypothetical protein